MKKAIIIVFTMLISSVSISNPIGTLGRYFETYNIEFENKFLADFSANTLNDKIVYFKSGGYGVRLNNNHSFVRAIKKNQKRIDALWHIKEQEPSSKAFFDNLKMLLSEKGRNKLLRGFRNYNDQKSQFQRIEIVKELEKQGVLTALNAWSEEIRRKSLVTITPKKVPQYDFNSETFTFNVRLPKKRSCRYTANVSKDKAAELGSSWTIYWEAVYYIGDDDNPSNVEIYFGAYPPSEPVASFSIESCD
ncbi:hypothetical protein [Marinoscillum furvescens]|uniref:Uncharacterized protein n=1 Tax=Marinoscillum furvescens DSM 4134 TaxID=1122208 RepID=A0A3D9KZM0_MARFU|nr:hypothetical protein [Marinoscillum furvescens]RED92468.1 hypothetical protein C7460_13036 [Marinoscillum furvescens DSM 4134]